jgi:DNA helicase-2/ATP-dependent DNA helicase PcrA
LFPGWKPIYSDKIAKFICECEKRSGGAVLRRLKDRFAYIIVDEVQDMAGCDLDLIELMLKAGVPFTLVGDFRQATFGTNHSSKTRAFAGASIIAKFESWKKAGLVAIDYEQHAHRCNQAIADLGNSFFPTASKTVSKNLIETGHDGIFLVASGDVPAHALQYKSQTLRNSAATKCEGHSALNFGAAKGMTFERVLIFLMARPRIG